MSFTGPIEDRALIRELMSAYADATMRADREDWLACWSEDGVRRWRGTEVRGHAALAAQWDQLWSDIAAMGFFVEVGAIDVSVGRATARCFCREIVSLKNGTTMKVVGRYDDQLVRQNGVWRFALRDYTLHIAER
jgi:hypothetical protein